MIDPQQLVWEEKVYSDPTGKTLVHKGKYTRTVQGQSEVCDVAIKTSKLQGEELGRMIQELMVQSKLEDCRFICHVYGYFLDGMTISIVSEWLKWDLDKEMKVQRKQYEEMELMTMACQVVEALCYAKKKVSSTQNIAHRDIKPHNILRVSDTDSTVKIIDFGSGTLVDGKVHQFTGTPLYMSPEQIPILNEFRRTGVLPATSYDSYQSDVYSLGVTFLHLALLEPPINLITGERSSSITLYLERVGVQYSKLCPYLAGMLSEHPDHRYSLDQLHEMLRGELGLPPENDVPASLLNYQQYRSDSMPVSHSSEQPQGYYGATGPFNQYAVQAYQNPANVDADPSASMPMSHSSEQPQGYYDATGPFDQYADQAYQNPANVDVEPSASMPVHHSSEQQERYEPMVQEQHTEQSRHAPPSAQYAAQDYMDLEGCFAAFDPFTGTSYAGILQNKKLEYIHSVCTPAQTEDDFKKKYSLAKQLQLESNLGCAVVLKCDICECWGDIGQFPETKCSEHLVCCHCAEQHEQCESILRWY